MSLLLEPGYRRLLAETHPELAIRDDRLDVPTFVAPLDVREPLLHGAVREVVTAFTEVTPGLVLPRALFLGTPFERYDQTHLLDEVHDPAALAAAALEAGRAEDAAVVVMTNVSPAHPR
ncbi:MAG: hypothetical protein H6730_35710, partial [Deltaproteobacteria bacterium]|nr:hypothetical protein [Deltaproteobacteria bacterium]